MQLEYHELLEICDTVSLKFTAKMSQLVEKETRSQAKSTLWFKYRAGRGKYYSILYEVSLSYLYRLC